MLLPSDVARLVLGYLQQEKLTVTCRAFIAESPDLKEYAEYFSEDGIIPGCVLSSFGKNLTTILNDYIALKTKETKDEVPLMMSSLWKKLDHTLSQIRSMQNSIAFQTHQRTRTRTGIENIRRQRMLPTSSPLQHPTVQQTSTPIMATQIVLRPCNDQSAQARPLFGGQSTIQGGLSSPAIMSNGDSLQITSLGTYEKKSSAVSSPTKRKIDPGKRRRAPLSNTSRAAMEGETGEDGHPLQEIIDDNFPQLVIENAREKILGSKSLQEKLAENINKILGSEPAPPTSKQSDGGAVEQDASIDEILGLQGGEIHMSEEAIHDILVQTEMDPDFQELYDLFAGSSKATKYMQRELPISNEGTARSKAAAIDRYLDSVESSFDTDDSTSPTNNPANACSNKTAIEIGRKNLSLLKDDCASSHPSENEPTASSDHSLSPTGSHQSIDSSSTIDRTGEDTITEADKASQETMSGIDFSQTSDVEMKNVTEEVSVASSHLDEAGLTSSNISNNSQVQEGKNLESNREAQGIPTKTMPAKGHVSENTQKENISRTATKPCHTLSQQVNVLVSSASPVIKTLVSQKENDKPDVVITPVCVNDSSDDNMLKQKLAGNEQKTPQKAANVDIAKHQSPVVSETRLVIPTVQFPSPAGSFPPKPVGTSFEFVASSSGETVVDPSQIITLNIITEGLTEDTELNNAVTAIVGEKFPTVIMSPLNTPRNSGSLRSAPDSSVGDVDVLSSGDQKLTVAQFNDQSSTAINIQLEDCSVYPLIGTSNPNTDGGLIQLMPATSSTVGPSNNIFISACPSKSSTANQSNIMLIPSNASSAGVQPHTCVLQTPPRQSSIYSVGQTLSSKLSQGSTIILAPPVQPMLQSVVGMFPVSLVGQSGNTFTASSHQVLHIPVSSTSRPKLPLPPKTQKPVAARSVKNTGKPLRNQAVDSTSLPLISIVKGADLAERNVTSRMSNKAEDCPAQHTTVKGAESHRRVLCFDTLRKSGNSDNLASGISKPKNNHNNDIVNAENSVGVCTSTVESLPKDQKRTETILVSASSKDRIAEDKRVAVGSLVGSSCVVKANKENVQGMEPETQGLKDMAKVSTINERSEKNVQPGQESGKKRFMPKILRRTPQKLTTERPNLTSMPAKQEIEPFQGIQFQSPNAKHVEFPVPRTPGSGVDDGMLDDTPDSTRTPTRKRYSDDSGTPKPMQLPTTPDFPKCSPASEAGSESSVSIAAHTLMILSQASMTKVGSKTPLKDNTQLAKSSKGTSKKRKIEEPDDRHSHRTEHHSPTSTLKKKKTKKHRRKSLDYFPTGMDVDKFLMSLHYDE
ncbi:protein NPAT isoform X2 [Pelobates fuscus]|uniref:protein NPAT isoform X2 n=1 Tax=Pelobates fuscus TaxID=191477 RepID=UPI002FE4BBE2